MGDDCQLVGGVFHSEHSAGRKFAADLGLDSRRAYANLDCMIEGEGRLPVDERISLVTVASPNYLHYEMAMKLVRAGFHVICEKPMTTTAAEAAELAAEVTRRGSVFAVAHTIRVIPWSGKCAA